MRRFFSNIFNRNKQNKNSINKSNTDIINDINDDINNDSTINLSFEYRIVHGKDALETCLKIREEQKGKVTPVILGTKDDLRLLEEIYSYNEDTTEEILDKANSLKVEDILQARSEEEIDEEIDEYYINLDNDDRPNSINTVLDITANKDILTNKFHDEVFIGLIPTGNSYEVPAYMKFGNWNECPKPEEHVAILKYWYMKYGVQVISMTSDIIECTVQNPPQTKEESIELAHEQFLYCYDIVAQGYGTLKDLAINLWKSGYWYFWWD